MEPHVIDAKAVLAPPSSSQDQQHDGHSSQPLQQSTIPSAQSITLVSAFAQPAALLAAMGQPAAPSTGSNGPPQSSSQDPAQEGTDGCQKPSSCAANLQTWSSLPTQGSVEGLRTQSDPAMQGVSLSQSPQADKDCDFAQGQSLHSIRGLSLPTPEMLQRAGGKAAYPILQELLCEGLKRPPRSDSVDIAFENILADLDELTGALHYESNTPSHRRSSKELSALESLKRRVSSRSGRSVTVRVGADAVAARLSPGPAATAAASSPTSP